MRGQKVEGQRIDETAVDQDAPVEMDRRQQRGQGRACGNRGKQRPAWRSHIRFG